MVRLPLGKHEDTTPPPPKPGRKAPKPGKAPTKPTKGRGGSKPVPKPKRPKRAPIAHPEPLETIIETCTHCGGRHDKTVCPLVQEDLEASFDAPEGEEDITIPPKETRELPPRPGAGSFPTKAGAKSGEKHRERANRWLKEKTQGARDIAPLPIDKINWDRRLACKNNLLLFSETYLRPVFYFGWSDDQLKCIRKVEIVFLEGGMFALAMPRGGGKTAICRSGTLWGTAYAHRRFPFIIGSTDEKSTQTLDFIKTYWYRSKELQEDFPEIAYPVLRLGNRYHLASGQLFLGETTHIEWGSDTIRYPSLLLPKEISDVYLHHDPDSLKWIESQQCYTVKSAGTFVGTAGIDGSIRGEADVNPITLEQPRPDVILLDDIQKDQKAESLLSCQKLVRLIDGAVSGLAGPGESIAALMPCTVIREDDVSDTYLDRSKRPEWQGERCKMVTQWPEGITDFEISLETEEGRRWNEYSEIRARSYNLYGDNRQGNAYYAEHREVMDRGFKVSWQDRYTKDNINPHKCDLSPQQHAMNLRLKSPETFPAEFQNQGRRLVSTGGFLISAKQLAEKTIAVQRRHVPADTQYIVSHLDIQNEIFYYTVLAVAPDFTGVYCDYGTFPETTTHNFTKNQTEGWSLLTHLFFQSYPHLKAQAIRSDTNKIRAPLEAKVYHALTHATNFLLDLEFLREDEYHTPMKIQRLGIDIRWGQANEPIKRFCKESGRSEIIPCYGQPFPLTRKQLEEYQRTKGWLFEDQINPRTKEVKWVYKPDNAGQYVLMMDGDRLKTFLMERLGSPPGSKGSLSLYQVPSPDSHFMFCNSVCNSEYPTPVTVRDLTKDLWQEREGGPDNDYLDSAYGCIALASMLGASLRIGDKKPPTRTRRRLSEQFHKKRSGIAPESTISSTPSTFRSP